MPVFLEELALSVARCSELLRVDQPQANGRPHPCHKVVHSQDEHPGQFQVPEAWAGNLEAARVVFISSNPAISAGNPNAKRTNKRLAEKYPTVEWTNADVADFMTRRFTSENEWVADRRHLKADGNTRGYQEPYWTWIKKQTESLLGADSVWHQDSVMTEVVHCKSNKEIGVAEAAAHCAGRHLDRILSATNAELIVIVGSRARKTLQIAYPDLFALHPRFGVDEGDRRPDPLQNILPVTMGGRKRLLCFLWHQQAGSLAGKITDLEQLYPSDFHRLRTAARGH